MNAYHLHSSIPVTRMQVTTREYALYEPDMPKGKGLPEDLLTINEFLNPENSKRYGGKKTFTHVFAYDFCYLAGCYIPNLWPSGGDLTEPLTRMNARTMWDWFIDCGMHFGWQEVETEIQAQDLANVGHLVTIIGSAKTWESPGCMTIVMPSTGGKFERHNLASKDIPHQARAGKIHIRTDWYKSNTWREYKIWVNYLK